MNLKRQLLLVSLLALLLPWAGCQFVRETETALRTSQQQMLGGTARAVAESLSRQAGAFGTPPADAATLDEQLYVHALEAAPVIDGYIEDWPNADSALRRLPGDRLSAAFVLGEHDNAVYLFLRVSDADVVYADPVPADRGSSERDSWDMEAAGPANGAAGERVRLVTVTPPHDTDTISFVPGAPGAIVPRIENAFGYTRDATVRAVWQDVAGGYQLEARIPRARLGTRAGLVIDDAASEGNAAAGPLASYAGERPPPLVAPSSELTAIAENLVQPGMRLVVTDAAGWRIAAAGRLGDANEPTPRGVSQWLRLLYDAVVEDGTPTAQAAPAPGGREQQDYVRAALDGEAGAAWFRSDESDEAIVAVAQPVSAAGNTVGAVVLQQGTEAILSLTNRGLVRLLNVTVIAMLLVGGGLLGYATWLSRRIRRLSVAAHLAADYRATRVRLPSAGARDEIGDLSRSFSTVMAQLGEYNEYLRTLASKLSHELRTPLAIVTSSLENLEQESLDDASRSYTARARDGAERLRRILAAMSEASRVEELASQVEPERFDLAAALASATAAYRDVYRERQFRLQLPEASSTGHGASADPAGAVRAAIDGSPELLVQLLDKLIDNAVSFSKPGDSIDIALAPAGEEWRLDVGNPGPPLPAHMQGQLFDSMVSVRERGDDSHLGLGLYVARLIATGHNGRIEAGNTDNGVRFTVWLPRAAVGAAAGDTPRQRRRRQ